MGSLCLGEGRRRGLQNLAGNRKDSDFIQRTLKSNHLEWQATGLFKRDGANYCEFNLVEMNLSWGQLERTELAIGRKEVVT